MARTEAANTAPQAEAGNADQLDFRTPFQHHQEQQNGETVTEVSALHSELFSTATDQAQVQQAVITPPRENISDEDLRARISSGTNLNDVVADYRELIRRSDERFLPSSTEDSLSAIPQIQKALEEGTSIDGSGRRIDDAERVRYHAAILGDLDTFLERSLLRKELAHLLRQNGRAAESGQLLREAVQQADVVPVDMLKRQSELLRNDAAAASDPKAKEVLRDGSRWMTAALNVPIDARKGLLAHYLGARIDAWLGRGGQPGVSLRFGSNPGADYNKAFETAEEMRQKTIALHGIDPVMAPQSPLSRLFHQNDLPALSEVNAYDQTTKLSGRQFPLVTDEELGSRTGEIFDKLDADRNGYISIDEANKVLDEGSVLPDSDKRIAAALRTRIDAIQSLSNDEWGFERSGASRNDLTEFVNQARNARLELERAKQSRDAMFQD